MIFSANNSPLQPGRVYNSRHLRERLFKEAKSNVSLKVEETDSPDSFKVSGRGELHLSVLIETMRREGFEFQVSKPMVIIKEIKGKKIEPIESVVIDIPDGYLGTVMEKMGARHGQLVSMENLGGNSFGWNLKFYSRSIRISVRIYYRHKGEGIINAVFAGFTPIKVISPPKSRIIGSI